MSVPTYCQNLTLTQLNSKQEQQQLLMFFQSGVIVKIYKSKVDPILVGGRLRRPKTKMGISSGPMTLKF